MPLAQAAPMLSAIASTIPIAGALLPHPSRGSFYRLDRRPAGASRAFDRRPALSQSGDAIVWHFRHTVGFSSQRLAEAVAPAARDWYQPIARTQRLRGPGAVSSSKGLEYEEDTIGIYGARGCRRTGGTGQRSREDQCERRRLHAAVVRLGRERLAGGRRFRPEERHRNSLQGL